MKSKLLLLTLTVGAIAAVSLSANAQLIAYEGFGYAPGINVIPAEGTGGSGWAAPWNSKSESATSSLSEVSASSLSYGAYATVGGSLISGTTNSTTAQPERAVALTPSNFGTLAAANPNTAGELWVSYLWKGLNTTGSGSGLYRQSIMMFITGATTATGSGSERLDIGMPNISAANQGTVNPNISLWAAGGITGGNGTLTSTTPLQSSVAANDGSTTFVLVKFTLDALTTTPDAVSIWLNPALTLSTPIGTPDLTWTTQDMSGINGLRIQSGNLNATFGNTGGQQQVDEIKIGYSVLSVETVPEPTSLALLGLGSLAFIQRLRRK